MLDQLAFSPDNRERIQAVENSFGPSGKSLVTPGRVLIGEGRLMKMSQRSARPQPKVFFLFNDILVYGSIILHGRWHKNQQIIPLEDIQLEDLEDGLSMKNQWLVRTPRKSFYVAAASPEEKRAWMDHIEDSRSRWLLNAGRQPGSTFAVTWIPDRASAICMRCSNRFSATHRRHHCRNCGFVVCGSCSKHRSLLAHIHPTKLVRVCGLCHASLPSLSSQEKMRPEERPRPRGNSDGKNYSDEEVVQDYEASSDEEEELVEDHAPSRWLDTQMDSWSTYIYLRPEQEKPKVPFEECSSYSQH